MWTSCMAPDEQIMSQPIKDQAAEHGGMHHPQPEQGMQPRTQAGSARRMQLHGLVGTLARLGITSDLCGPHNLHQQGAGLRVTPAKTWLPRTAGRQPPIASSRLTYGSLTMSE